MGGIRGDVLGSLATAAMVRSDGGCQLPSQRLLWPLNRRIKRISTRNRPGWLMADDTPRFARLYPHQWLLDPRSPARAGIDNYRHGPDPACTCADCRRFRNVNGYQDPPHSRVADRSHFEGVCRVAAGGGLTPLSRTTPTRSCAAVRSSLRSLMIPRTVGISSPRLA